MHKEFTNLNFQRRYNLTGIKKRKESGLAISNTSPSLGSPPFPSTCWMTRHSLHTVSLSTTPLADKCLTSVSIFSRIISPSSPFSYWTVVIIRKFFWVFSQSRHPQNNLQQLNLILLRETFPNKLGHLCSTLANTWRWFPCLTGSKPSSFLCCTPRSHFSTPTTSGTKFLFCFPGTDYELVRPFIHFVI